MARAALPAPCTYGGQRLTLSRLPAASLRERAVMMAEAWRGDRPAERERGGEVGQATSSRAPPPAP